MKYFKIIFIFFLLTSSLNSDDADISKNIFDSKNIWIKTFINNKNYYITINNIVKIEQKIKNNTKNTHILENLNRRLEIQKSKLSLYEKNKSFNNLLLAYKFNIPEITAYDYIYKNSKKTLNKQIEKLIFMKNEFNKAFSLLKNYHKKNQNGIVSQDDIRYFDEFFDNINKTYFNLLDTKDELDKKYEEYYQEKLQKHIITFVVLIIVYILYRVFFMIYLSWEYKFKKDPSGIYKKTISIIFYIMIFLSLIMRYMEDFIYVITFLSVVAAALTIALREIILNIVASIYIFFSNMLRIGDRVMVQFETKHTIGDIQDISLMKIKLNEIEDYSNLKEVRNVGRTIYIPNSYVFTKVFYNYSKKKNGLINDLIEFEFSADNNFEDIKKVTRELLDSLNIDHTITFTLNNLKTGIICLISYEVNFKDVSKIRSELCVKLLQIYTLDKNIKLKNSKASTKAVNDEE
ncbi:mechanosensitive ion channel [Sulfurimonas lithotrophica]|uniref:Mechanosensitive ion channel n=1 Tax=Sulfurimonas lithotrophica TaxID=2590022 RepID=A0A5P8NYB6_9BACT|nr:mechanosensitive ion channel domain-containing protein [Sulfurimonas lithotrophica]QFR48407.1 mechanosensitive ion channel [Sulfurimonas lithotrophica]